MLIKFIGSSHGVPEPNRKNSCTMIEVGGSYYFIDMGTSPLDYMITAGIAVEDVKGIFITHMHGDHLNGLISFVDLISWYFTKSNPVIFLPNMEGVKVIDSWIKLTESNLRELTYKEVVSGVIFDDGKLRVTAIPTKHSELSYAYLLEAEGKSIVFTGDLKHPDIDFPIVAKERVTDLIVCESAHFEATKYLPHLKACNTKIIYINHYQEQMIPSALQLAKDMGNVPVKLAYDGSEIRL